MSPDGAPAGQLTHMNLAAVEKTQPILPTPPASPERFERLDRGEQLAQHSGHGVGPE